MPTTEQRGAHRNAPSPARTSQAAPIRERVRAAPAARALAKRLGVDLTRTRGSGRGGVIIVDDVMTTSSPTALHTARDVTALKHSAERPAPAAAAAAGEPKNSAACAARWHKA